MGLFKTEKQKRMRSLVLAGIFAALAAGTAFAEEAVPVAEELTEEQRQAKLMDSEIEYQELPELIEIGNTQFLNQLAAYENNPDGKSGLSKERLLELASYLRDEASELKEELDDGRDEMAEDTIEKYEAAIKDFRHNARELEKASEGKTPAGAAAKRDLRGTKNRQIQMAQTLFKNSELQKKSWEISQKELEIASLSYDAAVRKQSVGIFSGDDVLLALQNLDSARTSAVKAESTFRDTVSRLKLILGIPDEKEIIIMPVPAPDLEMAAAISPAADLETAVSRNENIIKTRNESAKAQGGVEKKRKELKRLEEEVDTDLNNMARDVSQKLAALMAAETDYESAGLDLAAAKRKLEIGLVSRNDYMSLELDFLRREAAKESAAMALTTSLENYQWAVNGLIVKGGGGS